MSFTPVDLTTPGGDTVAEAWANYNAAVPELIRNIVFGAVPGYNWSYSGADPAAPDAEIWTYGSLVVRVEYTYSSGRVATALHRYSTNGGAGYTNVGTETYSYDGNGYLTGTNWSGV